MNTIGLHLRITESITDCLKLAIEFDLPCFQCFFIHQPTKQYITLNQSIIDEFLQLKKEYDKPIFAHLSYWMNLARPTLLGDMKRLRHEVSVAKRLGINDLVMHPGYVCDGISREKGISLIVKRLNRLLKTEQSCTILLENVASGEHGIGSSIEELAMIRARSDFPERIQFCIDTAHAFTHGYQLNCSVQRASFIKLLDEQLGLENIKLLHLNDTLDSCGSKKDRHAIVGDGLLGKQTLMRFIHHDRLRFIPAVLELPPLDPQQQLAIIKEVNTW